MGGRHPVVGVGGVVGLAVAAVLASAGVGAGQEGRLQASQLEVYDTLPPQAKVHVYVGERRQFAIWAKGEDLRYRWTLDGETVGTRSSWTLDARPEVAGTRRLVVTVEGAAGRAYRGWLVRIDPAPGTVVPTSSSTTSAPTTTTTTARPTTTTTTSTVRRATTTTSTTRAPTTLRTTSTSTTTTRAPVTTTMAGGGVSAAEVQGLLDRYAAAWRLHDVATLEAIGQVNTSGQAEALRSYFDTVGNLEVEVMVLEIRAVGDEAFVRFVRRDRFRDPGGTVRTQESPPIEKRVIRTRQGLRFAPVS